MHNVVGVILIHISPFWSSPLPQSLLFLVVGVALMHISPLWTSPLARSVLFLSLYRWVNRRDILGKGTIYTEGVFKTVLNYVEDWLPGTPWSHSAGVSSQNWKKVGQGKYLYYLFSFWSIKRLFNQKYSICEAGCDFSMKFLF